MGQVNLYEGKVKKSFFKDEEQRNLWVKLNAERIRHHALVINGINRPDLGDVNIPYTHLSISNNQLTYDEYLRDEPRFSLEELSSMSYDDLLKLSAKRNAETIKELFEDVFNDDDETIIDEDDFV